MSLAKRKRKQTDFLNIVIGVFFSLIVIGAVIWYFAYKYINPTIEIGKIDNCPIDSELITGHSIFLIDSTDKISFRQEDAIEVDFLNRVKNLPEYHRVSLFALTNDLETSRKPVISLCTPRKFDKSRDNEFTTSKAYFDNLFIKRFNEPLKLKLSELINSEPAANSPIFEMLQLIKIDGFDRLSNGNQSPNNLIIYSDMLHNTKHFSHFQATSTSYEKFITTSYGQQVSPNLRGISISINLLMNNPNMQTNQLIQFWRELVKDRGGRIDSINHYPG